MDKAENILAEIKKLEKELKEEIQRKQHHFFYTIKDRKVHFEEEAKAYHKTLATNLHTYIFNASFANMMTAPIVWACLFPALLLDLVVSFYQFSCFRIYGIPKVTRSDYIVIDRHTLRYLNTIEKLNCIYCGYFNGLIAYIQEIAARTEQYWCPIKHAKKLKTIHNHYPKFLEFGECDKYQQNLQILRQDLKKLADDQDNPSKISETTPK